jgi:hypothetical protein
MSLKEELDKRKEGSKIEFGKDNDVENTTLRTVYPGKEEYYTNKVYIPEVSKEDGSCSGECPVLVHKYEDYMECVLELAEEVDDEEHRVYGKFYPGPKCARYMESQIIRQILKDKSNERKGK